MFFGKLFNRILYINKFSDKVVIIELELTPRALINRN